MSQSPLGFNTTNAFVNPGATTLVPQMTDQVGAVQMASGGISSALNLTAGAHVVKATPGRICKITVNTTGTAGTFSVSDCATTAAVAAANLVAAFTNTTAAGGAPLVLDWPCSVGIVVTVPTTGVVSVSFS
jgi:hypothetical protein